MIQEDRPAYISPSFYIHNVQVVQDEKFTMLMITILNECKEESITGIKALIDCGAQGQFIDQNFVRKHRLKEVPLERKIKVFNVDGTKNKKGTIRHKVILTFRPKG